ncbi:MAG: hypothetical protein DWQ45_00935 [Planctomycetota bacterium]|nr:MAG: hypothetical protein DWQ41_21160 [Planctomycetota bacterium]REK39869.1 MAG: hypothetical protein DWQ45_00935 [Planctomycetota bacterium]
MTEGDVLMMFRFSLATALFACLFAPSDQTLAAETVAVVVGEEASDLERFAAEELAGQFGRVFEDVNAAVSDSLPDVADAFILVGSPESNPHVKQQIGDDWPTLSDQGLFIRSVDGEDGVTLIVGGGSPAATLWSVYELGHQLGIRYLLFGDIDPAEKQPFDLSGYDIVQEPVLRSRTWRTINDFPVGPESWGLADHERVLRQLAKLKYNRLMLQVYPWQPFVQYEYAGVAKQTAVLWYGEAFPIDRDSAGRKAFLGKELFENPDFAGLSNPDEMTQAGIAHVHGLIELAHSLGMSVGISISPLEFPREFQSVLKGSDTARGINDLTIIPGADQGPTDETLRGLTTAKIRAYLETYPNLDTLYLTMPEFPEWDQHAEEAWELLSPRLKGSDLSLQTLLDAAAQRMLIATGSRGEQAVKGNVVGLAFFHALLEDEQLLQRPDGDFVDLVITAVDPVLFPVLDEVVPPGAATLNFIDYTARRVAANRELLEAVPADKVDSRLILTLADDNVGVLPQSGLRSIASLVTDLKDLGWDGFSTRYWIPAELDSVVYSLSRASWDPDASCEDETLKLWEHLTSDPDAAERLQIAWNHLEDATDVIDENGLGFAFPVPGMLMKHYVAEPEPEWWQESIDHYTQYMIELYRANGAADPRAKDVLFYYAKRGEYVLEYWAAVQAVRAAAIAREAGDSEGALTQLETALEQMYNCINTLADVARDQSDLGLIAVLNAYAYRPLLAEVERLAEEE